MAAIGADKPAIGDQRIDSAAIDRDIEQAIARDIERDRRSGGEHDRTELREWHSYTGDEDPPSTRKPDHGTSKNQVAWLEKGMAGADFGKCNTWSASSKSVK